MSKQSVYPKVLESAVFNTQVEALEWGNKKKAEYKNAGETVKVDTNPVDATRRRWKTTVYLKVEDAA